MNTQTTSKLTATAIVAVALGLFAATPFQLQAQAKGSAKGGATKLMQLNSGKVSSSVTSQTQAAMACPNCANKVVVVRDVDPRGAGARALGVGRPLREIARHQCGNCVNEWKVAGHGKAKSASPVHKCARCS